MSQTYFTADWHFSHPNIARYCPQFRLQSDNTNELNEYLIDCWNRVVTPQDTVYNLGDVCFAKSRVCNVEIDVVIDDCSAVESTALLAVSVRKLNTDILSFLLIHFVGGFAFFDPFASCDKCAPWNTRALLVQLIACRGKRLQSLRKLVQPICLKQFDLTKKAGFISKSQELSGSCPVHCSALVRLQMALCTHFEQTKIGCPGIAEFTV